MGFGNKGLKKYFGFQFKIFLLIAIYDNDPMEATKLLQHATSDELILSVALG